MIIQIGDFEFDLSEVYAQGHSLTLGEAHALNGLRAERIRGVLAREIASSGEITGERLIELKARASELDKSWEFIPPARPKKRVSTELEILVNEIAQEKSRSEGGSVESWATAPSTIDQARAILGARRAAAARELEDL